MSEFKFTELQEKWLKALESGEYKQGRQYLFNGRGFCCLGVACDLVGMKPERHEDGEFMFDFETETCPLPVMIALKLRDEYGGIFNEHEDKQEFPINGKMCDSLASANDKGLRFKTIAAFVRANPEKVFTGGAE